MNSTFSSLLNHRFLPIVFAACIFTMCLIVMSMSYHITNLNLIISSDQEGYFQYLPHFFINGDLHRLPYAEALPNGNTLNLYHIGVAILEAPFFLLAHLYALAFDIEATGYTRPYLISIFFAAAFYLSLSCYLLVKVLDKYFSRLASLSSILLLILGTNLLYYSTHEVGMSHVYSFFLFSFFIYQIDGFLKHSTTKRSVLLGVTLGLITIVRPSNLIIGLCIPLWGISSFIELKARLAILFSDYRSLATTILSFCIAILPQLLYWKLVTGNLFVFSYGLKGQGFNWTSPELFNVLFSPQNGWLIYSPLMVLSLIGLGMTLKQRKYNSAAIAAIIVLAYYIISSWWAWWFGGAFGHRAFVDFYPLLLLPMVYVIQKLLNLSSNLLKGATAMAFLVLVVLNLKMTFLYRSPWDGPDWGWDDYRAIINEIVYGFF